MKQIFKFFKNLVFLVIFSHMSLFAMEERQKLSVAKYLFCQQFDSTCFLMPMKNLERLDFLTKKYGYNFAQIPEEEWFSKVQWLGEGFDFLKVWYDNFSKINDNQDVLVHLKRYFADSIESGSTFPNYYDRNGKFYFQGVKGLFSFAYTPFFLTDCSGYQDLPNETDKDAFFVHVASNYNCSGKLTKPVIQNKEDGKFRFYDPETRSFEEFDCIENIPSGIIKKYDFDYDLDNTLCTRRSLGFEGTFFAHRFQNGFGWHFAGSHNPYMQGIYKLLLLRLGVNENHEDIDESHELNGVVSDLRLVSSGENNPWSDDRFNRENFLQFKLASIFKETENSKLFKLAQKAVDFGEYLKPWQAYRNFFEGLKKGQICNSEGIPYNYQEVVKFIPGREQALAFMFTSLIRLLWYGSLNEEVFYSVFINRENANTIKVLFDENFEWSFELFKTQARERKFEFDGEFLSFIDVWHLLQDKLGFNDENSRKNWINFDDHGWVISFDQRIIEYQINFLQNYEGEDITDVELLSELRIAGIDSWKSSLLKGKALYSRL